MAAAGPVAAPQPIDRPPPSFKDVVARPVIPITEVTELKIGGVDQGEPAFIYSNEEYNNLAAPFDMVLVGQFSEARPNMVFLRKGFELIGFKGAVSLGMLDSKHVLIRFSLHEDFYRCWIRGSWNFKNHVMKIIK